MNRVPQNNGCWVVLLSVLAGCHVPPAVPEPFVPTNPPVSGASASPQPSHLLARHAFIDADRQCLDIDPASMQSQRAYPVYGGHTDSFEAQRIVLATAIEQPVPPASPAEPPDPSRFVSPLDGVAPLTLETLEEIALASNPSLAAAQARVDAARGRWLQAGLPPNLVLGYSGQQLGSDGLAEQNGVLIGQEVVRGGKLRLARAVADQEIAIADRAWEIQMRRVLTDVHLGYYDVLVAQRRLELADQIVSISDESFRSADALLKAMEVSRADVLRAQIELQTSQATRMISQNQLTAAWARLAAVLGTPDLPMRPLADDLHPPQVDLTPDSVLTRLLAESPELHAQLFEVERARWAVNHARALGIPNVEIEGVIQQDNGTGSSNGNLQVSLPIPWLNYNQGGIREAQANLVAAEFSVAQTELRLQQQMATVFQRYASARDQVELYARAAGILENANATLSLVRDGYRAGEFGYLDLLTAQRSFAQTNLAYLEALGELWFAYIELEGLLLKNSLDRSDGGE